MNGKSMQPNCKRNIHLCIIILLFGNSLYLQAKDDIIASMLQKRDNAIVHILDMWQLDPELPKLKVLEKPGYTNSNFVLIYFEPENMNNYLNLDTAGSYIELRAFKKNGDNDSTLIGEAVVKASKTYATFPHLLPELFRAAFGEKIFFYARYIWWVGEKVGPWSSQIVHTTQDTECDVLMSQVQLTDDGPFNDGWSAHPVEIIVSYQAEDYLSGIAGLALYGRDEVTDEAVLIGDIYTDFGIQAGSKADSNYVEGYKTLYINEGRRIVSHVEAFDAAWDSTSHGGGKYTSALWNSRPSKKSDLVANIRVKVDVTKPVVTIKSVSEVNGKALISFTVSDALSGVDNIRLEVTAPGSEQKLLPIRPYYDQPITKTDTVSYTLNSGAGEYLFRIIGSDVAGNFSWSSSSLFEKYNKSIESLIVYPNPFIPSEHGQVTIETDTNVESDRKLKIYDLMGNLVLSKEWGTGGNHCYWDGKNNNGEDVETSGYLVILGKLIDKVAVIRK